jgi:hypothetical protein
VPNKYRSFRFSDSDLGSACEHLSDLGGNSATLWEFWMQTIDLQYTGSDLDYYSDVATEDYQESPLTPGFN